MAIVKDEEIIALIDSIYTDTRHARTNSVRKDLRGTTRYAAQSYCLKNRCSFRNRRFKRVSWWAAFHREKWSVLSCHQQYRFQTRRRRKKRRNRIPIFPFLKLTLIDIFAEEFGARGVQVSTFDTFQSYVNGAQWKCVTDGDTSTAIHAFVHPRFLLHTHTRARAHTQIRVKKYWPRNDIWQNVSDIQLLSQLPLVA